MKHLNKIKFICGFTLVMFAVVTGIIFFLESFSILRTELLAPGYALSYLFMLEGNPAIFLGLCGLAGAHLLASIKQS